MAVEKQTGGAAPAPPTGRRMLVGTNVVVVTLVVVGIVAFLFFGGYLPGTTDTTNITVEAPAAPATTTE